MSQNEVIIEIFPFNTGVAKRRLNLLHLSRASHPEFTDKDSLVEVDVLNAESALPAPSVRERRWQLKDGTVFTVNLETGNVIIEGQEMTGEALQVKVVRADLNRQ